jgi:acid stress-induced BolA-like protein IbaG/YrbA
MHPDEVKALIEAGLPDARVEVRGEDMTHFEAVIVSEAFEGLRTLQRHQLVYKALGERMGREIHALSMRTLTPAEFGQD